MQPLPCDPLNPVASGKWHAGVEKRGVAPWPLSNQTLHNFHFFSNHPGPAASIQLAGERTQFAFVIARLAQSRCEQLSLDLQESPPPGRPVIVADVQPNTLENRP
jgi:hypothetical protein